MKIKYPRTTHLPWSPGRSTDDVSLSHLLHFQDRQVVVTEKMDGENMSLYADTLHARSLDSGYHPSRSWIQSLHAQIAYRIPTGWRVCGENLYARHSIAYDNLPSYFIAFSVWNEHNQCLSWEESLIFFKELNLCSPRVLYQGTWCEKTLRTLMIDTHDQEGYVVRVADAFDYKDFGQRVAKWVRPEHVQQDQKHWMHQVMQMNKLQQQETS